MFAFLMALAMTVQLVMPAWADVAQEETAETVATEEAQGATEEAAEEPTEEVPEETEGETEEATEGTEAATEETTEESTEALPEETEEEETEPEETVEEAEELEAGTVASGTCGENLTWVLDDGGTLTVEGSGEMEYDHSYGSYYYPWRNYREQITEVSLSEGVTSIGPRAFEACENIRSVTIPGSVTTIGVYAFQNCANLIAITFEHRFGMELTIGSHAFDIDDYRYNTLVPIVTSINVPSEQMINQAIADYKWKGYHSSGDRELYYQSTGTFPIEGISLSTEEGNTFYELGNPVRLTVDTDPIDATGTYQLFVVENKTTAKVYVSNNKILTTLSTGTVTLRAESVDNPEISSELTLSITEPTGELTNLTVTTLNDYPGEAELGKPVQMVPVFTPANAADRKVTWSVQNGTGSATIDENGLLTPISFGTVAVYAAASNGVEGSCTVNIVRYAEEIMILMDGDPDISRLGVGEGKDLSVLFSPDDCTTDGVKWTVVNGTGVAELDSNKSRLTGKRAGTITLIATANDSKKQVAKKEITITDTIRGYALPDGSGNIYYNTETGTITGSDSSVRNVIIPSQIDGVTIVKIAPYAFKESYSGKKEMTSVSIPATVTEIGKEAFYYCGKLSVLRFAAGSQLKKIGERAFCNCESLTSLEIPNSVTEIGDEAFKWLKNLKNITLSGTLNNEKWLGRNYWTKDDTLETATFTGEIVQYGVPAKKIILADTVTEIGQSAFGGISHLEEVVIGKKLQQLEIMHLQIAISLYLRVSQMD